MIKNNVVQTLCNAGTTLSTFRGARHPSNLTTLYNDKSTLCYTYVMYISGGGVHLFPVPHT